MQDRKLNVTTGSPHPSVRQQRTIFDRHIDNCDNCQPSWCWDAQTMWRALCLEALRLHGAPVKVVPLAQKDGA